MPGGVNSPVRAFKAVGGDPLFIVRAEGASLWDADGRELLDLVGSWGPMILGHNHPDVVAAIKKQLKKGCSYGAPTQLEIEMAELITSKIPSVEVVRMVNSGTEATMSAIRLARAATGRDKIIKFEGCYHGHGDSFLSKAGSGAATFGVPDSPGVPKGTASNTLNARYNDLASVQRLLEQNHGEVAGLIVEPVVGNMGTVAPRPGFLQGLRDLCTKHGALLIFDEVMTGFRVAPGGAQEKYGVRPDLTTLGKIIGGGLPVGAYGGRRDLMLQVSPAGPMYQAGTLSGNPLAMAAGLATLRCLFSHPELYDQLEARGKSLEDGITAHIRKHKYPLTFSRVGSMATLFFNPGPVENWDDASLSDKQLHAQYFWALIQRGVYMPPSQYEAFFFSTAHTKEDFNQILSAICAAVDEALTSK